MTNIDQFSAAVAAEFDELPPIFPLTGLTSAADAHTIAIPPREWIWDGLVPAGAVTLFTGSGGDGKSLLAKQIATHVAAGEPLFGRDVTRAPVLAVYGEDDEPELIRRQQSIMREAGIAPHMVAEYRFKSLFGEETSLGSFDKTTGLFVPSDLYTAIRDTALAMSARLIVLDNVTQMFVGDVNNRGEVTRFLQCLNRLALAIDGGVLLLGHIAKSEGSTYAGTAAWRDGVRHAFMISRPDNPNRLLATSHPGCERLLKVIKSNYGGSAELKIMWDRGAFREIEGSHANIAHSLADDEEVFLHALEDLTAMEVAVSPAPNASNFAPRVMEERLKLNRKKMAAALDSLLADERLHNTELDWRQPNRTRAKGLALKDGLKADNEERSTMTRQHDKLDDILSRINRRSR